jgi:hypothetical protein
MLLIRMVLAASGYFADSKDKDATWLCVGVWPDGLAWVAGSPSELARGVCCIGKCYACCVSATGLGSLTARPVCILGVLVAHCCPCSQVRTAYGLWPSYMWLGSDAKCSQCRSRLSAGMYGGLGSHDSHYSSCRSHYMAGTCSQYKPRPAFVVTPQQC